MKIKATVSYTVDVEVSLHKAETKDIELVEEYLLDAADRKIRIHNKEVIIKFEKCSIKELEGTILYKV